MHVKFEWTPDISVGEVSLDTEHRALLEAINKLLDAILNNLDKDGVAETLAFLDAYVDLHFNHEEKYMKEHGYPEFEEHKELHSYFILQYNAFKERLDKRGPQDELVLDVETYLGNWWLQHIGNADKKYADFVVQKKNAS
jgi:hemerythrin